MKKTHGMSKSPEFRAWQSMIQRCHNPRQERFKDWGGRGIGVCIAWRESFSTFLRDVGTRPSSAHQLDRINNALGYKPGNVRWATRAEQQANTRKNVYISFKGETLHVSEWSRRLGLHRVQIPRRLAAGWSVTDALTKRAVINGKEN